MPLTSVAGRAYSNAFSNRPINLPTAARSKRPEVIAPKMMLAIASQLPSAPMIVHAPVTPASAVRRVSGGGCGCGSGGCDCASKSSRLGSNTDRVELSDAARAAGEAAAPANSKPASAPNHADGHQVSGDAEQAEIARLKARDAEVRAHEMAHKAAAGGLAGGGPSYEMQRGPDGRHYAVGGEVQIDTSEVSGDPAATIRKMTQVIAAALAPAQPSGQDRAVAAAAQAARAQAQAELTQQRAAESDQATNGEHANAAAGVAAAESSAPPRRDRRTTDYSAPARREPIGGKLDLAA